MKARDALIGSAIAEKNDVLLSIFAEIAMNYMQLRSSQSLAKLVETIIELTEKKVESAKKRVEKGLRARLDLVKQEAQLSNARAQLPDLYATIYQSAYALSTLIGEPPETLLEELLPQKPLPSVPTHVAIGLRSDLIRRRPDIRRAERVLAAATANVGVAVASFFPSLTLGGDLGLQSLKFANLFTGMSKTWSYGGAVSMPLFQGGKLIGNLRLSEAEAIGTCHYYQKTVLSALEEAESNLASFKSDEETLKELQISVSKESEAACITKVQHTTGLVSLTDYLDSALNLNQSEQTALITQTTTLIDLISLYKALGGGFEPWNPCED